MLFSRGEIISSRLLITILIGLVSWLGDSFLYSIKNTTLRAISDNLTHALVGGLSWSLIIKLSKKSISHNVLGITLCFFLSSFIDLDHFLLAKSWKLRDALHLGSDKRPILHCSIIPLLLWLIFEIIYKILKIQDSTSSYYYDYCYYYCWVIITAFLSHHIRDANRRGLWFGFIGSTPPIPYYFYLFIAMGLPHLLYSIMTGNIFIKDNKNLSFIQTV